MGELDNRYIIIIPAYKPDIKILELVGDLKNFFENIIVVNDGNDNSYNDIFNALSDKFHCIIVRHYTNLGKGRALKSGFNAAFGLMNRIGSCRGVITVDADGQHLVSDIIKVRDAMEEFPRMLVLGCREFNDKTIPFRSRFGNKITTLVFRWLCGLKISDTQTGLRGIPAEYIANCCKIEGEKYEYETNMLLSFKRDGVALKEVGIETVYEGANASSHFNPLLDSIKIYQTIFKYSLASLLSVIIDFCCFQLLWGLWGYVFISTYLSRAVAAGVNFTVNRAVVFRTKGNVKWELIKYVILLLFSATFSALAVSLLGRVVVCDVMILKMIVETVLYFFNYYVQNTFVFKREVKG